jgi:hypothetical protein
MINKNERPFSARQELEGIKKGRKEGDFHGQEGLDEVKRLKEKLKLQRIGLVDIQNRFLKDVNDLKFDFNYKRFLEENKNIFDKYLLGKEVVNKIEQVLLVFQKRVNFIEKLKNNNSLENGEVDSREIFEKVFKFKPQDDIKAIVRPIHIYFKIKNQEDFATVYSDAFMKKRRANEGEVKNSKSCAAALIEKSFFKDLDGALMIENPDYYNQEEASKDLFRHEEVHSLNNAVFKAHLADDDYIKDLLNKIDSNDQDKLLDLFQNASIEKSIKDEILAQFEDVGDPRKISKVLLKDGTNYSYGFDYDFSETDGEYMSSRYIKIVQDGIIAFSLLLRNGFEKADIRKILVLEPLAKWEKVAERMIGDKRSSVQKNNDKEIFIDKDIIQKEQETKDYIEGV